MSSDYEIEQRQLKADVERMETDVAKDEEVTANFRFKRLYYNAVGVIDIPTDEELKDLTAEHAAKKQKEHIIA